MRLGIYSLLQVVRKVLKKSDTDGTDEAFDALKGGIRRMKRETERSIVAHFKDYRENIKFQYLLPLADAAGRRLYEALTGQFDTYGANLKSIVDSMSGESVDMAQLDSDLNKIAQTLESLQSERESLRRSVDRLREGIDVVEDASALEAI